MPFASPPPASSASAALCNASHVSQYFAAYDKRVASGKMHNKILFAVAPAASLEIPFRKNKLQS